MAHVQHRCANPRCRRTIPTGDRGCRECGSKESVWVARYRDTTGAERSKSFGRKTDAEAYGDKQQVDKRGGTWTDPRLGEVPFAEHAAAYLEGIGHLAPGTRDNQEGRLRNHVLPHFGRMPIGSIRSSDCRAFISSLIAAGLAPDTVRATFGTFSKIMRSAARDGVIARNPCIGIELPRMSSRHEMRFLEPGQIAVLADSIDPRYRALIYSAAYTGLRWGELAALRVERVNLLRGTLDVVESLAEVDGRLHLGPTKTGARRTVALPRFLAEMIGEHLGRYPSRDGHVFSSAEGTPLRRRNFYRRHYKPAVHRAGLDPALRFHDLRHTCAALLIAQGAHAKSIAERLGHSTVRLTLDRYGHLLPSLDETLRDGLEATFQVTAAGRMRDERGTEVVSIDAATSG